MTKKTKDPLQFTSIVRARDSLRKRKPVTTFKHRLSDPAAIVKKSVEGNIFRVFGGLDEPSLCFRDWGNSIYHRLQSNIASCSSQQQYDRIIQSYSLRLASAWEANLHVKLPYGPATKMVNLLIKAMYLHGQIALRQLPRWYNVPFDSFTLVPLIQIIDQLLPDRPFAIPMNHQMTMNYVLCEEQYRDLQNAVRKLCKGTGRTPLDYEIWAWDSRH